MKRFTRISLRTLLILITVFAVLLAVQVNRAHRQREVVAWVKANGGWVGFDWQFSVDMVIVRRARELFGREYFGVLICKPS